jgi:hypothetical protein
MGVLAQCLLIVSTSKIHRFVHHLVDAFPSQICYTAQREEAVYRHGPSACVRTVGGSVMHGANGRDSLGQRQRINMYDPAVFRIRIQGELAESWSGYFDVQSMAVQRDEDGFSATTVITGLVDQAALLGMINHLNCLGLPLKLVEHLPTEGTEL